MHWSSKFWNRRRLIYTVIFSDQLLFEELEISKKQYDITYFPLKALQNAIQSKSEILLIDGRSESAYHEGHIPEAVNIRIYSAIIFLRNF